MVDIKVYVGNVSLTSVFSDGLRRSTIFVASVHKTALRLPLTTKYV